MKSNRLLGAALLSGGIFVAAFALAFFAMMATASADHEPGHEGPVPAEHAGSGDQAGAHAEPAGHGGAHGGHHDPSQHFNYTNFSYSGKDQAGGPYGDGKLGPAGHESEGEEERMSPPFILMVVNFVILLLIFGKAFGPNFKKLANERHDSIKTALEEAAKLREEAATKLKELETRVKAADAEIKTLVEGMRADAETDKKRILENAEKQAAQMKRDAEQRIAAEIEFARAALRKEVTAAATVATEALLKANLQAADQQKLVASFITDLQKAPSTKEAR